MRQPHFILSPFMFEAQLVKMVNLSKKYIYLF